MNFIKKIFINDIVRDFLLTLFSICQKVLSKLPSGVVLTYRMWNLGRKPVLDIFNSPDYIRIASLELVAAQIEQGQIKGDVAELGVYQGHFAQYLNQAFPNRKLNLFDTFEGFNEQEELLDKSKGFYKEHSNINAFKNTSVDLVLKKMPYQGNCIIKKGYFPKTTEDMPQDATFAFVSIDTDLHDPIVNGLNYFYPRLENGGVIFVHDFNCVGYSGVKPAVEEFLKTNNIIGSLFPLCDAGGTAVIIKS